MEVILARPRGFCAGVNRAINVVNKALEVYKPPVYVLHEIVHNTHVIRELEKKGAVFVEQLED
ncbi:4-hydroxy-3-methylbut-2-enyl diphosphate reductase, partial [Candidatus Electrothrix marina]